MSHAPENTWLAYKAAIDAGFPAIELDVVPTKDGALVCSHNFDLERITDGVGYIHNKRWSELGVINAAAHWPGEKEKIPLLEDVLARLPRGYFINIEIKTRKILDGLAAIKVARIIGDFKIQGNSIVSSFNPFSLRLVKWMDSSIKTGFLFQSAKFLSFMPFTKADYLHPRADIFNADLKQYALRHNLGVNVWTVNTKSGIEYFINQGVDGIITDWTEVIPTVI
ncbi:MAG: glycerophosphodiester phosphodiesterase family protein [Candidatus Marinimicrobia bacterium]|nr:glycerophosphodiester phosphodiesterase family protein [Candidatus Neomarinimicrobiota bacterium]